jgi:hypothetical protein
MVLIALAASLRVWPLGILQNSGKPLQQQGMP